MVRIECMHMPWAQCMGIWIIKDKYDGVDNQHPLTTQVMLSDGNWVNIKEGGKLPQPTYEIPYDNMQRIVDACILAGIAPTNTQYTNDTIRATQNHLQDMRKLVAYYMDIEL